MNFDDQEEFLADLRRTKSTEGLCPLCEGTERRLVDGVYEFCKCWRDRVYPAKFREAGIPEAYYGMTLSDWNINEDGNSRALNAREIARKENVLAIMTPYIKCLPLWCASPPMSLPLPHKNGTTSKISSLAISGNRKSGKTMLAALIGMGACRFGLRVKFYQWAELVPILTSFENREQQDALADEFRTAHYVIIDNIRNTSINYPYFRIQLERLSGTRLASGKPTILTFYEDDRNGYTEYEGGSVWESLIKSCFSLPLPRSIED